MIVINGYFLSQRQTGVQRYALEMTRSLLLAGVELLVVAPRRLCQETQGLPLVQTGHLRGHLWEQISLPYYVARHYPGAIIISFSGLSPILYSRSILTIHDVSFLHNPSWFSRSYYWFYRILTPLAARRACRLLTVSEFSRSEIVRYFHLPASKILVAYNGVSDSSIGHKKEGKERYILCVGSLDPRKNIENLIEAFYRSQISDCRLYIVGLSHETFAKVHIDIDDRVQLLGYVGGAQLGDLYANALAHVSISYYEGFGLTNIEAMANGCPVLISDIPAYREVCADAALYCNPFDKEDIAAKLRQITCDSDLRHQLSVAGFERARHYTWNRSAQLLIKLIKTLSF